MPRAIMGIGARPESFGLHYACRIRNLPRIQTDSPRPPPSEVPLLRHLILVVALSALGFTRPAGADLTAPLVAPIPIAMSDSASSATMVVVIGARAAYETACSACHTAGIAGAPKVGDLAAWGPRIAQGKETLYTHAIQGFTGKTGVMPAKGGRDWPDDLIKQAVDHMLDLNK